ADSAGADRPDGGRSGEVPAEPGVLMPPAGLRPRAPGRERVTWAGVLAAAAVGAGPLAAQVGQGRSPYLDPALPVERRIDDLLGRITLEEKVGQMLCLWQGKRAITDSEGRFDPSRAPERFRIGVGRIERPGGGHG